MTSSPVEQKMEIGQNIFSSRSISITDIPNHEFIHIERISATSNVAEPIDEKAEYLEMSNIKRSAESSMLPAT